VSDSPGVHERRSWRWIAASALPALVALWALWRDVYMLDASGLVHLGGARANVEWAGLCLASTGLVALFWSRERALRVLAYTLWALVLSVGFGVAGVLGVMHAFGGPDGNLDAPAWALWLLGLLAAVCVAALLATAALIVADVREGDALADSASRRSL
jgi:drug/metabolite transporter (DMT)-like permease